MTPGQLHALKIARLPLERRHAVVLARRFAPPSTAHVRALDLERALPGRAALIDAMAAIAHGRPRWQQGSPFVGRRLS